MFQLTRIDGNSPISSSLAVFNANYTLIESAIDDIQDLLSASTNTLKLTNLSSLPNGGLEAAALVATRASGNSIAVSPSGGSNTFVVDADGNLTAVKATVTTGSDASPSVMDYLKVTGEFTLKAASGVPSAIIDGALDLNQTNSVILKSSKTFSISNSNTGSAAASPLSLAGTIVALLDYDNSGVGLSNSAEVTIDPDTMELGQEVTLICSGNNTNGQKLYNGGSGTEIFAKIDPDNGGAVVLANTSKPTFDTASGLAFLKVMCVTVSASKRLLIVDHKNMTNI